MKRIAALLLVFLMMIPTMAGAEAGMELAAEITGTRLLEKWNGETSNDYDWFVIDMQLTNWHIDAQAISSGVSGRLVFRDTYIFDAEPAFDSDTVAPLVRKNGALVFEIPKLVAESFTPEDVKISITVEGTEQAIDLNTTINPPTRTGKLEGPGYDTPEEAVLAYLDALNRGSPTDMLSTFALESFVDHVDPISYTLRLRSFQPTFASSLPINSNYSRELMLNKRYGDLASSLFMQYVEITTRLGGKPFMGSEELSLLQLLDWFTMSPVDSWKDHIAFVEWLEPASLSDHFFVIQNIVNVARVSALYGVEDYALLAAHIRLNGVDGIQTMGCAKYDNRWYNVDLSNNISNLLSIDSFLAGLIYSADSESEEFITGLLASTPTLEASAMVEGWRSSGLIGTHWRMIETNQPGMAVVETAEGIRTQNNPITFADLRFLSCGGAYADIRYSPSLDSVIGNGSPVLKVGIAWTSINGKPTITGGGPLVSGVELDMENVSCTLQEDTLILRWPSGLQATFQRIDN